MDISTLSMRNSDVDWTVGGRFRILELRRLMSGQLNRLAECLKCGERIRVDRRCALRLHICGAKTPKRFKYVTAVDQMPSWIPSKDFCFIGVKNGKIRRVQCRVCGLKLTASCRNHIQRHLVTDNHLLALETRKSLQNPVSPQRKQTQTPKRRQIPAKSDGSPKNQSQECLLCGIQFTRQPSAAFQRHLLSQQHRRALRKQESAEIPAIAAADSHPATHPSPSKPSSSAKNPTEASQPQPRPHKSSKNPCSSLDWIPMDIFRIYTFKNYNTIDGIRRVPRVICLLCGMEFTASRRSALRTHLKSKRHSAAKNREIPPTEDQSGDCVQMDADSKLLADENIEAESPTQIEENFEKIPKSNESAKSVEILKVRMPFLRRRIRQKSGPLFEWSNPETFGKVEISENSVWQPNGDELAPGGDPKVSQPDAIPSIQKLTSGISNPTSWESISNSPQPSAPQRLPVPQTPVAAIDVKLSFRANPQVSRAETITRIGNYAEIPMPENLEEDIGSLHENGDDIQTESREPSEPIDFSQPDSPQSLDTDIIEERISLRNFVSETPTKPQPMILQMKPLDSPISKFQPIHSKTIKSEPKLSIGRNSAVRKIEFIDWSQLKNPPKAYRKTVT